MASVGRKRAALTATAALALLATGCQQFFELKELARSDPKTQAEAGSTHAFGVAYPWRTFVDAIQPTFPITPELALASSLPTTASFTAHRRGFSGAGGRWPPALHDERDGHALRGRDRRDRQHREPHAEHHAGRGARLPGRARHAVGCGGPADPGHAAPARAVLPLQRGQRPLPGGSDPQPRHPRAAGREGHGALPRAAEGEPASPPATARVRYLQRHHVLQRQAGLGKGARAGPGQEAGRRQGIPEGRGGLAFRADARATLRRAAARDGRCGTRLGLGHGRVAPRTRGRLVRHGRQRRLRRAGPSG